MKTIYIPVSVEDENDLPKENGFWHFKIRNEGNLILCHFNSELQEVHDADIIFHNHNIEYWLKPIQIPEDKFNEIIKSE